MKKTEKMLIKFIQYFADSAPVICIIPFYIMIINQPAQMLKYR